MFPCHWRIELLPRESILEHLADTIFSYRSESSRSVPMVTALELGRADFPAGQRHSFKNLFVSVGRLGVRLFLFAGARRFLDWFSLHMASGRIIETVPPGVRCLGIHGWNPHFVISHDRVTSLSRNLNGNSQQTRSICAACARPIPPLTAAVA
jgi:hypothetical protein